MVEFKSNNNIPQQLTKKESNFQDIKAPTANFSDTRNKNRVGGDAARSGVTSRTNWFSGPEYIPREHSFDVSGFGKNPKVDQSSSKKLGC